jgi:hypothetical protein
MPKRWVKAAYYDGIQHPRDLAELFDVSPRAMEVRLSQLGLTDAVPPTRLKARFADRQYRLQPRPRPDRYYRPLSRTWLPATEEIAV